jgi:GntR family transcriptional repressor for pyruvate dehydrogenase complex
VLTDRIYEAGRPVDRVGKTALNSAPPPFVSESSPTVDGARAAGCIEGPKFERKSSEVPSRSTSGSTDRNGSELELPEIQRPESLSHEVSRRLLTYLLSGRIEVGERLPSERELAARLGVGRSAVRDGLRPLVLLGVLEVRPGSGTYLRGGTSGLLPDVIEWGIMLGDRALEEIVEARGLIEVSLARLAALRRDDATIVRLKSALNGIRDAKDVAEFTAADVEFHLCLADASGNGVLTGVLRSIRTLLATWIRRVREREEKAHNTKVLYQQHLAIADAVELGDGDAAAAAMQAHMDYVTAALRASLVEARSAA